MKKLLMVIFTENSNIGASMLCSLAQDYGWKSDIYFVSPEDINNNESNIENYINEYKPDLISLSFKSFERNQAFTIAKKIKDLNIKSKLIAGGIHPTLMPEDIIQMNIFDAIVIGDGMGIWSDLLTNYIYLENNKIIYGIEHQKKELYIKYYHSKSQIERMKSTKIATVLTAIGCPYNCAFCHSGKQSYVPFPIENVALHVLELHEKYGVENFHFLDDLFTSNLKKLRKFREILEDLNLKEKLNSRKRESNSRKRESNSRKGKVQKKKNILKIKFSSQVSSKVNTFNENIAEELIKLGVETVNFGVETASPRLLEFLKKKQTVKQCYNAIEICHKYNLNCVINLMFGIPTQNENDYKETLEFVKKSKPDGVICFYYTPYPGTELYDYCFEHGYLPKSFNKNRFEWFIPSINGTTDIQIKLNKIDYDLAKKYAIKIKKSLNQDKYILERLKIIDTQPWIIIGTFRHDYYRKLIKKLSLYKWNNFKGYINTDKESGFQLEESTNILFPELDKNINKTNSLFWAVTYSFIGSDFELLKQYIKKYLDNIPLISISSFKKSHSPEYIKNILNSKRDNYA